MEAWYTINTKPQSELRANDALRVRGFETYLPMLPTRHAGRCQPLFPAYLFVRCEIESVGVASLQWIPGLRRVVSFGGRPAVVPDQAIELIRSHLADIDAQGGLPSHSFKPGDTVVIDRGPLAGLRGVFQGPLGPAERVQILIRFLGQSNRAEVPVELLRTAPEEGGQAEHRRRGTRGRGRRIRYQPEKGCSEGGQPAADQAGPQDASAD